MKIKTLICSDIYTTPRLAESLDNVISIGNTHNGCIVNGNNSGTTNANSNLNASGSSAASSTTASASSSHASSLLNSNSGSGHTQRHRIDALTTISTSISPTTALTSTSLSQSMDGIVDTKLRQGQYFHCFVYNDW